MTTLYSPDDIQRATGKKRETIRTWSETFAKFLSPGARPEPGKHRVYDDNDLKLFLFIRESVTRGIPLDEVAAALAQPGAIDKILATTATTTELTLTPQQEITTLKADVADLQNEVAALAGQNKLLKDQLAEKDAKIDRLVGENAVLKSQRKE